MQHISSFTRTFPSPSLIISNRDKRTKDKCSLIMITGIIFALVLMPLLSVRAEAPAEIVSNPTSGISPDNTTEVLPETVSESPKLIDGLTVEQRAAKIDAFYAKKGNLPLTGQGIVFVTYADKYGLDWRLVAAKGFIETTGGKFACKNDKHNTFGWGSCRGEKFDSYEDAIETVTRNLGGHNPNTAYFYKDKSVDEIIDAYNPPSVRANYKKLIKGTMDAIAKTDISENPKQLAFAN